jgi:hypothetical protein
MSISIGVKQRGGDAIVGCDYVFPPEIETETRWSDITVAVTLVAGKVWRPVYFTPGSAVLSTTESIPFEGRIVENKFEMKIPGGSAYLTAAITQMCGRAVVLRLTFESGAMLLCGGKAKKLRFTTEGTLGTMNGNVIGFTYRSKKDFRWIVSTSLNDQGSGE